MEINQIVPWGRSLTEYQLMFNLSAADLNKKILGCGDGPASFNAEMTKLGYYVLSIDPIYQFSSKIIKQRIEEVYEPVINSVKQKADQFIWQNFQDADQLGKARLATMEIFLEDYELGKAQGRYLCQSLPNLDFKNNQFDLCLCSHLLFLYSEQLSLEFHLTSLQELLRVASEIRVFPLFTFNTKLSPHLDLVIETLSKKGFNVQLESVSYEFQKGANQMLKIK